MIRDWFAVKFAPNPWRQIQRMACVSKFPKFAMFHDVCARTCRLEKILRLKKHNTLKGSYFWEVFTILQPKVSTVFCVWKLVLYFCSNNRKCYWAWWSHFVPRALSVRFELMILNNSFYKIEFLRYLWIVNL